MKILFLVDKMVGGGAERFASLLSDKMIKNGHEVSLVTDTEIQSAYPLNKAIKIYPLLSKRKGARGFFCLLYMLYNVRKVLKQEKPSVIIGVMPIMNMLAVLSSVGLDARVIASHHTSFDRKVGFHIRFIQNYIYRFASAVTILTQVDYKLLGKKLPRKFVMPNPLSFPCVGKELIWKEKIILVVGRLDVWEIKGFDTMIKIWARIAKKYSEWKLVIAGGGSDKSKTFLTQMADNLGVSTRVEFLGFRNDIDLIMRKSSIFALSSRVEGFGMVLIEAMSQGCACIAFDCGGRQREIIQTDQEGIIIENRDELLFQNKLQWLMQNDDERLKIARNGIKRASQFNCDIVEKKWENLIESI